MDSTKLIVRGRVQGVGFRATATILAAEMQLTGWVKNKADGTVEIIIQGNSAKINEFIERIKQRETNRFARVDEIVITTTADYPKMHDFQTIY